MSANVRRCPPMSVDAPAETMSPKCQATGRYGLVFSLSHHALDLRLEIRAKLRVLCVPLVASSSLASLPEPKRNN